MRQIGSANAQSPTVAGMAISIVNLILYRTLETVSLRLCSATALVRLGISDDDKALDNATGMLKRI